MADKQIIIDYKEYASEQELEPKDQELAKAAHEALKGSYSPYSHFRVGAALLLADGTVVKGANQENAAYPAGLCAERTAMFAASANYPDVPFDTLAIVAEDSNGLCDEPATPCGNCRQVMAEYQSKYGRPLKIILLGRRKVLKFSKVDDILPFIFDSLKV
ncbi:MAG: cytidine deaminase [Bacteroidales bacterium]|nr:cytidine deaminase [Bacteroidales bacterium]